MSASSWRLDNIDGSWFVVLAPNLLPNYALIKAYYQELRNQLSVLKFSAVIEEEWIEAIDSSLLPILESHYSHIAKFFNFSPTSLTPISRYKFFIATEPVEVEEVGLVTGLSGLEQLLGYSYDSVKPDGRVRLTSGDTELDIVTAVALSFKESAQFLLTHYSLDALSKMVRYASDLARGEEVIAELQAEKDKELFEKNLEIIGAIPL